MDARVKKRSVGAVEALVVDIKGKVGVTETPRLRELLTELLAEKKSMVINMANIQYIDSSCLGTLISIRKELARDGHTLKLVEINDLVREVLELTQLLSFFDICETEEEALHQLK